MAKEKNVQAIRDKQTLETFKQMLKKQSYRDYFLFTFGINTGMKVRDLLSLKVIDVNGRTHVEKDNKRYPIQKLQSLIEEYILGMQEDDYLFPSRKKDETGRLQPISDTQAYRALRVVAEQMGLDYIGTQTMRKTFGYWHYQQYKDVKLLQELLHQQSPSKTLEFIGATKNAAEDSAEEMDLL